MRDAESTLPCCLTLAHAQDPLCNIAMGEYHCNAHSNNLVVLAEGSSEDMFLGYVDLDMAFDDKTFVQMTGKHSTSFGCMCDFTMLTFEHVSSAFYHL